MARYRIEDWAGNILYGGKTFPSFEDAWDHLYTDHGEEATASGDDDYYTDFYVEEVDHETDK